MPASFTAFLNSLSPADSKAYRSLPSEQKRYLAAAWSVAHADIRPHPDQPAKPATPAKTPTVVRVARRADAVVPASDTVPRTRNLTAEIVAAGQSRSSSLIDRAARRMGDVLLRRPPAPSGTSDHRIHPAQRVATPAADSVPLHRHLTEELKGGRQ